MKAGRGYEVSHPDKREGKTRIVRWSSRVRRSMRAKGWTITPVRGAIGPVAPITLSEAMHDAPAEVKS